MDRARDSWSPAKIAWGPALILPVSSSKANSNNNTGEINSGSVSINRLAVLAKRERSPA
jgi:hypothetical protein